MKPGDKIFLTIFLIIFGAVLYAVIWGIVSRIKRAKKNRKLKQTNGINQRSTPFDSSKASSDISQDSWNCLSCGKINSISDEKCECGFDYSTYKKYFS